MAPAPPIRDPTGAIIRPIASRGARCHNLPMLKPPMIFAAVVAAAAFPGTASAQLLRERVEGSSRFCTYEPSALPATVRAYDGPVPEGTALTGPGRIGPRERTVRLEYYEACPAAYPSYREQRVVVPSMARLERLERQRGQTYCVYGYLGRTYVVARGQATVCTLTPSGW